MAAMDIIPAEGASAFATLPTKRFAVAASATLIYPGEPVKTSTVYVTKSADAEPVTSSPTFVGIAATTSTNTASAVGYVDVIPATIPGQVYMANAKTAASVATQALYDALRTSSLPCLFDLTSTTFTVDTDATGATYGLILENMEVAKHVGKVAFSIRLGATIWA